MDEEGEMKIYWRYKDVPELAALSWREQRKVVRVCIWKFGFRHWQCWVVFLVCCLFIMFGVTAGVTLQYEFGFPLAVHLACNMIGLCIGSMIYHNVLVKQLRPHFRDYIAKEQ